jgi:hypothetical protein
VGGARRWWAGAGTGGARSQKDSGERIRVGKVIGNKTESFVSPHRQVDPAWKQHPGSSLQDRTLCNSTQPLFFLQV